MPDSRPHAQDQERWMIRQAFGRVRLMKHRSGLRSVLREICPDSDLRRRAFQLAASYIFEGFCPIHEAPLEIVEGGLAWCKPCLVSFPRNRG